MTVVMRIALAATLAWSAFTAPAFAQTAREPEAIVRSLYESTIKDPARPGFGVSKADQKLLTKSLDTLWKRADKKVNPTGRELGVIDWDLISNSQDPAIKSFTLKTESRDEQRATVAAAFTSIYGSAQKKEVLQEVARYDFLRENGAWKIDNVRLTIENKPWSLRAHLEAALRNCIGSDRPCDAPK